MAAGLPPPPLLEAVMFDTRDGWFGIDDTLPADGQAVLGKTLFGRIAEATFRLSPSPHWESIGPRQLECFPYWKPLTGD
jgi:hypothetical protein